MKYMLTSCLFLDAGVRPGYSELSDATESRGKRKDSQERMYRV